MKNLVTLILVSASLACTAQTKKIESSKLDSLVWQGINSYLVSLGKAPIKHFEDSLSREYSYEVTRANADAEFIAHSKNVGYVTTAECIYRESRKGLNNGLQKAIDSGDYTSIAKLIVDSWIASPTHRNFISINEYAATTVTTILKYDKSDGTTSVTASWHALDRPDVWKTTSGYAFGSK